MLVKKYFTTLLLIIPLQSKFYYSESAVKKVLIFEKNKKIRKRKCRLYETELFM